MLYTADCWVSTQYRGMRQRCAAMHWLSVWRRLKIAGWTSYKKGRKLHFPIKMRLNIETRIRVCPLSARFTWNSRFAVDFIWLLFCRSCPRRVVLVAVALRVLMKRCLLASSNGSQYQVFNLALTKDLYWPRHILHLTFADIEVRRLCNSMETQRNINENIWNEQKSISGSWSLISTECPCCCDVVATPPSRIFYLFHFIRVHMCYA